MTQAETTNFEDDIGLGVPPRLALGMSVGFVFLIVVLPLMQLVREVVLRPETCPTAFKLFPDLVQATRAGAGVSGSVPARMLAINSAMCSAFRDYETTVTTTAWPIETIRDQVQVLLTRGLMTGNEQVIVGEADVLYFRPDVDALTAPGFLTPLSVRPGFTPATRQTNPLAAIRQFRDDLNSRGIDLLVLPIPSKAAFALQQGNETTPPLHNCDYQRFVSELADSRKPPKSGQALGSTVLIDDLAESFQKAMERGIPCYLKTDTHWTPQGLDLAVRRVTDAICRGPSWSEMKPVENVERWRTEFESPIENAGDTLTLLGKTAYRHARNESVSPVRVVQDSGIDWQSDSQAKILVLGDSFVNMYSQPELGWGTAAGFAEHLSQQLNVPIDRIAINAGGALATRQELVRQLQQGNDRLAGKKLVIWAFAERELTFGDWQVLPLPAVPSGSVQQPASLTESPTGLEVIGEIIQMGRIMNPQSMPYREALLPIHLRVQPGTHVVAEKEHASGGHLSGEIVVYVWGLKDRRPTDDARFKPGQVVQLKVTRWADVESKYGRFARVELDDPDFELFDLPTFWGENVRVK